MLQGWGVKDDMVCLVECFSQWKDAVVWRTTSLVGGFSCSNSSLLDSARGELPTTKVQVKRLFRKLSKGQIQYTIQRYQVSIYYIYIVCSIFGNPATYTCMCIYIYIYYDIIMHTYNPSYTYKMYVSYLATSQTVSMATRWLAYSLVVIRVWRGPLQCGKAQGEGWTKTFTKARKRGSWKIMISKIVIIWLFIIIIIMIMIMIIIIITWGVVFVCFWASCEFVGLLLRFQDSIIKVWDCDLHLGDNIFLRGWVGFQWSPRCAKIARADICLKDRG